MGEGWLEAALPTTTTSYGDDMNFRKLLELESLKAKSEAGADRCFRRI